MKPALVFFAGLLFLTISALYAVASDIDPFFDEISDIQYFWPDTNFTFLSHGFPTTPRTQVLANGHLYVACGAYFVIYEVQNNGELIETCSKMVPYAINSMDHDGDYLYVTGLDGLEIYDGTDYADPQLIGSNPMRFSEWIGNIMVDGDSLYYWWDDNSWGGPSLGIMNIQDRSNPSVVFESDIDYASGWLPPQKYGRYLIATRYSDYYSLIILDLNAPSGVPELVDSLNTGGRSIKVFDNRLYVCQYEGLEIYEFEQGPHPIFRSFLETQGDLFDIAEVVIDGNRYGFVCSWDSFILKIDLNDLSSPEVVDSIVFPEEMDHDFREVEQYGNYSYAMTSRLNYYVEHPGVHVVRWERDPEPELIQSLESHQYCLGVASYNDALYAYTENGEIVVLDIFDRANPREIEQDTDELFGWVVRIAGGKLITSEQNTIIKAFDLADPIHPAFEWSYTIPSGRYLTEFYGYESYLILSFHQGMYTDGGLMIVDMVNPEEPRVVYDQIYDYTLGNFTYYHPYLYLINNEQNRLHVLDISDIENPIMRAHVSAGSPIVQAGHYQDWLYVNCAYEFQVWDVSNRDYPSRLENYILPAHIMEISNGKLFFSGQRDYDAGYGISVWDLDVDPLYPAYCGYYGYNYYTDMNYDLFIIDWPDVIIPGGKYGGVIARFDGVTGIQGEPSEVPTGKFVLSSYPNPFNQTAILSYSLVEAGAVGLSIYDILGRRVFILTNDVQQAGEYTVTWNALDLPSGVYFARLETKKSTQTIKMVLLK